MKARSLSTHSRHFSSPSAKRIRKTRLELSAGFFTAKDAESDLVKHSSQSLAFHSAKLSSISPRSFRRMRCSPSTRNNVKESSDPILSQRYRPVGRRPRDREYFDIRHEMNDADMSSRQLIHN
eukprot:m.139646 g.139646  ORF g.139646 m.139646 type:complete len:123 (+) comp38280_c2_seq1:2142-2510(+)